jgi:hypothetical protein
MFRSPKGRQTYQSNRTNQEQNIGVAGSNNRSTNERRQAELMLGGVRQNPEIAIPRQ